MRARTVMWWPPAAWYRAACIRSSLNSNSCCGRLYSGRHLVARLLKSAGNGVNRGNRDAAADRPRPVARIREGSPKGPAKPLSLSPTSKVPSCLVDFPTP